MVSLRGHTYLQRQANTDMKSTLPILPQRIDALITAYDSFIVLLDAALLKNVYIFLHRTNFLEFEALPDETGSGCVPVSRIKRDSITGYGFSAAQNPLARIQKLSVHLLFAGIVCRSG